MALGENIRSTTRRIEQYPQAGNPPIHDLGDVRSGNGNGATGGPCTPPQRAHAVMSNRSALRRESESRTKLLEKLTRNARYRSPSADDIGRLKHDRFSEEKFCDSFLPFYGVALVEHALDVLAQKTIVVRLFGRPCSGIGFRHGLLVGSHSDPAETLGSRGAGDGQLST